MCALVQATAMSDIETSGR